MSEQPSANATSHKFAATGRHSAFRRKLEKIDYDFESKPSDLKKNLEDFQEEFEKQCKAALTVHRTVKLYFDIHDGYMWLSNSEKEENKMFLTSSLYKISQKSQITTIINKV